MNYRVIIADDEKKILQLIRLPGKWEQYGIEIIDECHDGCETLESIKKNRPDFVISDIKMPELDGIELIKAVRDAEFRSQQRQKGYQGTEKGFQRGTGGRVGKACDNAEWSAALQPDFRTETYE